MATAIRPRGIVVGHGYTQAFVATMTPTGSVSTLRSYVGGFKVASKGTFRAVSRALNNMLTKNRDIT